MKNKSWFILIKKKINGHCIYYDLIKLPYDYLCKMIQKMNSKNDRHTGIEVKKFFEEILVLELKRKN